MKAWKTIPCLVLALQVCSAFGERLALTPEAWDSLYPEVDLDRGVVRGSFADEFAARAAMASKPVEYASGTYTIVK